MKKKLKKFKKNKKKKNDIKELPKQRIRKKNRA